MQKSIFLRFYTVFKKVTGASFSKEGFIRYYDNLKWFSLAKIFLMSFSLITTILVARILGPESYGTLNYVLSFVGLFGIIANLGIDSVVFRELTAHKERREEILGSALVLRLITGLIAVICVFITTIFISESAYVEGLMILFSISLVTQAFTLFNFDFLKDAEAKYATITQIITLSISNSLKVIAVYFFDSLALYVLILGLENILAGGIYLYQIKKYKNRTLFFKPSKSQLSYILSLSLPLLFVAAFTEIYSRIDQIMLKNYLDIQAVGFYSAAVRITELWYFIPNIIMGAMFPAFVNVKGNKEEYKKRVRLVFLLLSATAAVISIGIFFFGPYIIELIYGNKFIASSPILSIYILSLVGSFLSFILYQDLFIKNKLYLIIAISATTALINIVLNYYWIPLKGAAGAAWATVLSYNLIPILYLAFYLSSKNKNES